jgi:hypothetical protein
MIKKVSLHIYNKMKKCNKCLEIKELCNFPKNKRQDDGFHYVCKNCRKKYNQINQENIKEYREKTKEITNLQIRNWRLNNPERVKELWQKNNSKKTKEEIKLNNQKSKEYKKNWNKNQYQNNINYKISQLLRIRLLDALKCKKNKIDSSIKLLGCSIEEFKIYLEKQFLPEMSWENHGKIWEIDHIKPCALFDLTCEYQQKECFHHNNMQPLFKTSDIAKSFGYIDHIGNRNKKNNL